MRVVGVDGCPGGWIAITWDTLVNSVVASRCASFAELVDASGDAACIGVDMPIGLTACGARECDIAARRVLGPRRFSVFPAPQRCLYDVKPYHAALLYARANLGKGISQQAYNIIDKVKDVDLVLRSQPGLQGRVIEVHPEVSFWAMNAQQPLRHGKKSLAGFEERRALLLNCVAASGIPATRAEARRLAPYAGPDDCLDAIAVAWSARRFADGVSRRLPESTPAQCDAVGLPMEINY